MIFTNISQPLKNNTPIYFIFWANCILVDGYHQSIVFDIFRNRQVKVSKLFSKTYREHYAKSINELKEINNDNKLSGYLKIIQFFVKNDFGIYTDSPSSLPSLSTEYDTAFDATNVILHVNSDSGSNNLLRTIKSITTCQIQALEIIDNGHMSPQLMEDISKLTLYSTIEYIHIYTFYKNNYDPNTFDFLYDNLRFRKIHILSSPYNRKVKSKTKTRCDISYFRTRIDFFDCGNINVNMFVPNQPFFIEAHSCNTCLNRKVSIDIDGNIGNCPLMPHTFGNIKDVSLREVVSRPEFQRLWHITKDQIDVCKDCEYRYICTDCRHFIKDKKNIYSQPSKCGYNPYIAKWSDEEGYVPVEDCGTYSTETGFIPDRQRIEAINRQLERNEQLEK